MLIAVRAIMWSQHGFWGGLEPQYPAATPPGYYPAYSAPAPAPPTYYRPAGGLEGAPPPTAFSTPVREGGAAVQELTPPDSDTGEDKPFQCGYPKCSYETNRRNNLKRHMLTMHERLNSPHFCCGVTFFRKADMRQHTKEVHSEGYPCTWPGCGKGFVRKALLDRHIKIHTGEKPFVCPICQYGTSHKSNLDRHLRIHFKPSQSPGKLYSPGSGWESGQSGCSPAPPRPRTSFLFSPDKFSLPFSPVALDSITPLRLSPLKAEEGGVGGWWTPPRPANSSPPRPPLPGTASLTPNSSLEMSQPSSCLGSPPSPARRPGTAISHGIRSILGDHQDKETEEEIDVDGDITTDEETDEEQYLPKKLRLAKTRNNTEA